MLHTLACLLLLAAPAAAQDATEDKLRDLLRQTTVQMRAAQDNAATLQAQLDTVTRERDALQQQLAAARATPVAAPAPRQDAALKQAEVDAAAARAGAAAEAAANRKWQAAYRQAATLAQDKDASGRRDAALLRQSKAAETSCAATNRSLIAEAETILHLYETPAFNRLLVASHERLIGARRVELENVVQDYEDKLAADTYIPPVSPGP